MIQELDENCLIDGLEHAFELTNTESGFCLWECLFCLTTTTEYEDSQP